MLVSFLVFLPDTNNHTNNFRGYQQILLDRHEQKREISADTQNIYGQWRTSSDG